MRGESYEQKTHLSERIMAAGKGNNVYPKARNNVANVSL